MAEIMHHLPTRNPAHHPPHFQTQPGPYFPQPHLQSLLNPPLFFDLRHLHQIRLRIRNNCLVLIEKIENVVEFAQVQFFFLAVQNFLDVFVDFREFLFYEIISDFVEILFLVVINQNHSFYRLLV